MYLDALTMACVADELRDTLVGGRVQEVLIPDDLSLGFEVYAGQHRHYLLASAHPVLGRVLLSSQKLRRGVEKESSLLLLLRKLVRGGIFSSIEQPPFERILRLGLEHVAWGHHTLIVEIMGRHSNVILVGPGERACPEPGERVIDAVKRVDSRMSPARPVLPGQPYKPPPAQEKLPPSQLTELRLQQMLLAAPPRQPLWQVLVSGLLGVSPLLAREVAYRAQGQPRISVDQVTHLAPLLESLGDLLSPLVGGPLASLRAGPWQPTLVMESGQPVAYAPYRITHLGEVVSMPSISQAIERYTAAAATADPYASAKRRVQEAIAAERVRLEHRRDALEGPLKGAEAAEGWRQWGEWILAYAHTLMPRQTELVAETGAGQPQHIPLDPNLSPVQNAQAYFARYRKAKRAALGNPQRLKKLGLALQDLAQLESDLSLAASRPEIEVVRASLVQAGHVRSGASRQRVASPGGPLSLTSPEGLVILVGRNSRQNDEVTFRRAGGDDWWFHAHGVPGAHVVVAAGSKALPPATIQRAAELAAFFSPLRSEPVAAVDFTRRRYVRRIPGAAPGLVTFSQEQTIQVRPCGPDRSPTGEAPRGGP